MDNMNWPISAQLMRHWFDSPAWSMSDNERKGEDASGKDIDYTDLKRQYPHRVVDNVVKMDWLRGFDQVKSEYSKLLLDWSTPKSRAVLHNRLKKSGWYPKKEGHQLGSSNMSALQLDNTCQINYKEVGSPTNTFNDYFGAIFKASLKIAVVGFTTYNGGKNLFHVTKAGFYLRDTYDFNIGDGFVDRHLGLGVWSKNRLLNKDETAEFLVWKGKIRTGNAWLDDKLFKKYYGFVQVWNEDFKKWSSKHGKGGDFFVFSDVKWETPGTPIPVELPDL